MTLTKKDKAVLIGLIIGDGYLSKDKNQIRVMHSLKQKDYCIYKAKLAHSVFGGNDIKIHTVCQKYSTKIKGEIFHKTAECVKWTKGSKKLEGWRDLVYRESNKIYTQKILDMMDEVSLMLWWLDDGNLDCHKGGSGSICWSLRWNIFTSKEEILLIQKYFEEKWNVKWNIRQLDKRSPNKWSLSCGKREGEKFLSLFRERVIRDIPSMAYKVLFNDTSARHSKKDDDIV